MHNTDKVSENDNGSQTPGLKAEISGADAEISGVAPFLDKSHEDMPTEKEKDINNTSYEDKNKIRNKEE